ncbi:protein sidekick-1-like isoform X2 [Mercenaria mercenaria]|uniref:protein sidekick-1-like isoform X2 n=1 Tax=Mercenaria mercenaria TaxID=6596 RepID=UPI00234F6333|nr:protein sidekick-1-like isoform X2 [Mercenaria mercenaria]
MIKDQQVIRGLTATLYCGVSHDQNIEVTWKWTHQSVLHNIAVQIPSDSRRSVAADGTLTINAVDYKDKGYYSCYVTTARGNYVRSQKLTVVELPRAPIITSVKLHSTDERAAIVKWHPGYDGNTPITRFSVQYTKVPHGYEDHLDWVTYDGDVEPDVREATVTGLRPGRSYQFRVTTSNEVGEGLPSTPKPAPALEMPQQYEANFLVFSRTTSLESFDLDDENDKSPPMYTLRNITFLRHVIGLSFDYENEVIFYSDILRWDIQAVSFDGTNIRAVVEGVGPVEDLAFEKMNGDIYWTSYPCSCISKINVHNALSEKTRGPEVLVQMSRKDHPRSIAVDSCLKLIYWTNNNDERPSIQRSNLRGDGVEDIILKDIITPHGLTIDHKAKKFFWYDAELHKIERCDMDGSNRFIIATFESMHPFALAVYNDYLFLTDWMHRAVVRISKYDGTDIVRLRENMDRRPMGIITVSEESENCMINKCYGNNYGCQDKCYTDVTGQAFCECTYGNLKADKKTCASPTEIVKPPQDQKVIKGSTVTFSCGVSHDPSIQVTWKWTHRALHTDANVDILRDPRRSVAADGTLTIRDVNYIDIGYYTCHVTSRVGNHTKTVSLTVIELPQAPVITSVSLHPNDVRGVIVKWIPGYDGNTPITKFNVQYQEVLPGNGGWVTSDVGIQHSAREATVTGLRPAQHYQFRVFASNEIGEGLPSDPKPDPALEMPRQPPSSSPKGFLGMPRTNTSVILYWLPPDEDTWNGPLQGYILQYKLTGDPNNDFNRENVSLLRVSYELQGLVTFQEYEAQIAAYNIEGVGVFSSPIHVMTLEGHPTAPPEDLEVVPLNSTAVNVSWTPPKKQFINGRNLGYKVLGKRLEGEPSEFVSVVPHDPSNPSGAQQTVLHSLQKYTEYNITVLCYTSQGDGPRSVPKTVRTMEDVPSQVRSLTISVISATSLKVDWESPTEINGILIGYTLLYEKKNDSSTQRRVDFPPSNLTYTVSSLTPNTKYTISIYASTSVGAGQSRSADTESGVPPGPPAPPFSLAVSHINARSVILQFIQGSDVRIPITLWIVEALEVKSTTEWKTVYTKYDPSARSLQVVNLKPYTFYKLRIIAENVFGQSRPSEPTRLFQTLQDAPITPPVNVTVIALNATALRVSWTQYSRSDWNGEPRGFKIYYKVKDDGADFKAMDLDHSINLAVLGGLQEWMQYEVMMVAYNDVGESMHSAIALERTKESVPSEGPRNVQAVPLSSTSVNVSWGDVPTREQNGQILGFKVEYRSSKKNIPTQTKIVSGNTTNHVLLENLRKFVTYEIRVLAYTRMGDGVPSDPEVTVQTYADESPAPPFSLAVSHINARSVLLQFIPGFDGRSSITLWIVEALEVKSAIEWKIAYTKYDPSAMSLRVENLKPYTYYKLRIIAENIVGQSGPSEPTRLFQTLHDAPGAPPGNVTVRSLNATALRVSWTQLSKSDWNGEPRGYKIYYKCNDGGADFKAVDFDHSINLAVLGGLQEWMQYEVKMIAYNDAGASSHSPITVERTRESVPSEGPCNVQAVPLSSTRVNVSWGDVPTIEQNGRILGFKVEYRSPERNIPTQSKIMSGNTTTHVLLENLRKFVTYEIRVLAYTRMGDGVPSDPEVAVQTYADVPDPPQIIWFQDVSYSKVTVVWEPPVEPNGIITGYMVSYKLRDSPGEYADSSILSSNTLNYTVDSLHRESFYEFRVKAKTTLGWGETASVEVITMVNRSPPDSPSQPTIKSSKVQSRSVTISWIPSPFNGYGPLRNFTVQYKNGQSWISVKEPIPSTVTTYPVQGLRPDTEYVFRVAATNDIGTSPFGEQSDSALTLEDYPEGAPRNVKVDRISTTSVKVAWEQPLPNTWNGDLLGYVLMYRQTGNIDYMAVKMPVVNTEKVLPNLTKFVDYEFLVKAFNTIGEGPASTLITVFVGETAPTVAPVNIETTALNSTAIQVTWQPPPPETQNGGISGYRIMYWRSIDPDSTAKQVTKREQTVILAGLHIYTEYAISVQAISLTGNGPKSAVKYEKTLEGLPGKPASLEFWNVTYLSLDVHWEAPVKSNGKIISYELSYVKQNTTTDSKAVKFDLSGDLCQLNIKDLQENVTYLFSLSASTAIGHGGKIERSVTVGPQPGSPEAPDQLKINMETNEQKLMLEWKSGSQGQMPIYGHLIQAKQAYSSHWKHVKQFGYETQAEINLSQFKPNTEYILRVIALNPCGMSPYSAPSRAFRTPATATDSKRFLVFSHTFLLESIHLGDKNFNASMFTLRNTTFLRRVVALTFDYENETIFYSEIIRGEIQAVSFDGTNIRVVVEDVGAIEGLAYERLSGDIYMTSYTNSTVSKINVNDALNNKISKPEILIQLSEEDHPRAIAVDSCLKLVYWTNWNNEEPKIQRMNLIGEDVEAIITKNIRFPNGLTIDHKAKKLYWSDAGLDKIERCDMDGSNRVVIINYEPHHSFGLTVYDNYLFWTDWYGKSVMKANKYDGSGMVQIRNDMKQQPMGIIAVAEESENCMINECYGDNYGCQDKCYTDVTGQAFCQCTRGVLNADGKTCTYE